MMLEKTDQIFFKMIKGIFHTRLVFLLPFLLPSSIVFAFDRGDVMKPGFSSPRTEDAPEIGGKSQLQHEREKSFSPDDLDDPYRGLSGQAERSFEQCQRNLRRFIVPPIPNGRIINFRLTAKNKLVAQGGFTGPGTMCTEVVYDGGGSNMVEGYTLVVYRGGTDLEFPDFRRTLGGKIGQATDHDLGDTGTWQTVMLRGVHVTFTVTDPAPSMIIQDNRK